ncbi:hypothetical protein CHLNCDRAFT_144345 [Chlorella variabilis]|uniref:Uncharacterized protein n=1 Tax=Chlorella variabilis TaxID=554065 RepID=E1ZB83_CHLVA|nr:hypothetical protein CHLNCDRAFT_144345 [Chlorella variabilis]EFN56599.1 hypothetical protein CHLNCDRAFT_144345 [Chlorella variabilis]|eukprot:XP_005848701.1 hypothetical protein CHLNCDRAFT_144345 [Chlorella variabilis]
MRPVGLALLPLLLCIGWAHGYEILNLRRDWSPSFCYINGVSGSPCTSQPWAAFTIRSLMPVDLVNPNATRCAPLPYNATTVADIAPELDCYARYPAGARPA